MPFDYRPRLSIDLTPEQRQALDRILHQHGMQRAVFSIIVDDLISSVDTYGPHVIGGLLTRAIGLKDIIKSKEE